MDVYVFNQKSTGHSQSMHASPDTMETPKTLVDLPRDLLAKVVSPNSLVLCKEIWGLLHPRQDKKETAFPVSTALAY